MFSIKSILVAFIAHSPLGIQGSLYTLQPAHHYTANIQKLCSTTSLSQIKWWDNSWSKVSQDVSRTSENKIWNLSPVLLQHYTKTPIFVCFLMRRSAGTILPWCLWEFGHGYSSWEMGEILSTSTPIFWKEEEETSDVCSFSHKYPKLLHQGG